MENEDNFFREIEDTLHSYEDAYPVGAWEDFREKRKRKRAILFFRLGSAAAVLLFLSYAIVQFINKEAISTQIAQTKSISRQQKNNILQPKTGITKNDELITSKKGNEQNKNNPTAPLKIADKEYTSSHVSVTHHHIIAPAKVSDKAAVVQKTIIAGKDNLFTANMVVPGKPTDITTNANKATDTNTVKAITRVTTTNPIAQNDIKNQSDIKRYTGSTRSVYDSILNINKKPDNKLAAAAKKSGKNLSYGVVVSPALGNQKFNFGTGVEVAYKINKNLFVSSGIAYSSLNATGGGGKLNAAAPGSATSGSDVNLQVAGFEVPIGLQYRTDNGFYVSAGIVAMGVTNNSLQYNYITQTTAAVAMPDAAGLTQNSLRIVNEPKTEQSKEKIQNYLGFYMMSIGKKKKIGNNQFTFGPFVRIPFGAVSSQKISLFQGGVTLGLGF